MISGPDTERVKLDEILKSLFNVSKKVLVQMMNSLFEENYDIDNAEVTFENNEFISDEYDIIRGDLFLKVVSKEKPCHYHIELQTKNDSTMVLRMFEYGFCKAKELAKYDKSNEMVIFIPKQRVIFIEQNNSIENELMMRLVFPDGQDIIYRVPVVQYWKYDSKKIINNRMYPLLPLQIFKLRYKMAGIERRGVNTKPELEKALIEAKEIAEGVARESKVLYDQGEINGDDLHRILLAIANLFEYLNDKYGNDKKLNEEVFIMTKTLYDHVVEKRALEKGKVEGKIEGKMEGKMEGKLEGKIEVAKNLILLGLDIDKIVKVTGLPKEDIEKLFN